MSTASCQREEQPAAVPENVPLAANAHVATQLVAQLTAAAEQLGPDELAVLLLIVHRLREGRAKYGNLDVAHDPRCFRLEALAEMLDFSCYASIALLKRGTDG